MASSSVQSVCWCLHHIVHGFFCKQTCMKLFLTIFRKKCTPKKQFQKKGMHDKMLVESKTLPLVCRFSVVLMLLLFWCTISWFLMLISLVHNFLCMDVLLKTYFLYFLSLPLWLCYRIWKEPTAPSSDETKRENETMKSKFLGLARYTHSSLQETRSTF